MKIRYFDKSLRTERSVTMSEGKLIGSGTKWLNPLVSPSNYFRLHEAWMWEIFHVKITSGRTDDYLIVFYPKCYISNCEQYAQAQAAIPRSESLDYFLKYARTNQTFVLESCPAIKVPQILQSAFPDAHFAWKPFEQW